MLDLTAMSKIKIKNRLPCCCMTNTENRNKMIKTLEPFAKLHTFILQVEN